MIRVMLAGHRGRAGAAVAGALAADPGIDYVGGIGRGDDLRAMLAQHRPEAFVDFTTPAVAIDNA
ncbi:MAG: 4-hydroxy-tetrahydrodipicolinate reductase, partial [Candidatus Dormibacteraeota bacterium]|nr:4-hydroxy-tetrahydrodipicolinate reductase [Candidatus Dormibacteraeota bacterium]